MALKYSEKITQFAPFVRRIPQTGGAFFSFTSASEDLTFAFSEISEYKFRFSKYACLHLPELTNKPLKNTTKLQAIAGAYTHVRETLNTDWNVFFAESFQNYCLNLETHLLNRPEYDATKNKTVAERVFFKWLKEMSAIRFSTNIKLDDKGNEKKFITEEIDNLERYERVVKCIGDISASGTQQNKFATYTEIYISVPEFSGTTPNVLFNSYPDVNYKEGLTLSRNKYTNPLDNPLDLEIVLGRKYTDVHPDGLDIRAWYDNGDGFSFWSETTEQNANQLGLYVFKKKSNLTEDNNTLLLKPCKDDSTWCGNWDINSWWYSQSNFDTTNSYYTEKVFEDTTNDVLGIFYGQRADLLANSQGEIENIYSDVNLLKFKRSRLDGIEINWNLHDYIELENFNVLPTTLLDLATTEESEDYAFNAVLLYYDLYKTKVNEDGLTVIDEETITTNLFGVLFLDKVTPFNDAGGRIIPFTKQKTNLDYNKIGNEFGFKINLRVDTNTRLVNVNYVPLVAENNTIAMGMFMEALEKMVSVSDYLSAFEAKYINITEEIHYIRNQLLDAKSVDDFNARLLALERQIEMNLTNSLFVNFQQYMENILGFIEKIEKGVITLPPISNNSNITNEMLSSLQTSIQNVFTFIDDIKIDLTNLKSEFESSSNNREDNTSIQNVIDSINETKNNLTNLKTEFETALNNKEDKTNKSDILNNSKINYPSNFAVNEALTTLQTSIQNVIDSINETKNNLTNLKTEFETALNNEIKNNTTAISNIQNNVNLKEDKSNKSNVIDQSEVLYPSNKAVNDVINIVNKAIQDVADIVPYILQSTGNSTTDVMSQKAITDLFNSITDSVGLFKYQGEVDAISDLPNSTDNFNVYWVIEEKTLYFWLQENYYPFNNEGVDLSNYATNDEVHSSIMDITGNLLNLDTTNKSHLVGSINEINEKLDDQNDAIGQLQENLSQEITNRTTADANLQTQITTNFNNISTANTNISNLNTRVITVENSITNIKQFETYKAANETTALTYSQSNPNVLVYVV